MCHVADLDKHTEKHKLMHRNFQGLLFIRTLGTMQYCLTTDFVPCMQIESQCASHNLIHVVDGVNTKALVEHWAALRQL